MKPKSASATSMIQPAFVNTNALFQRLTTVSFFWSIILQLEPCFLPMLWVHVFLFDRFYNIW